MSAIRRHKNKVENDFSKENFDAELAKLKSDSVYSKFSFDREEYVLVRFMGRISISIGRRLGEIYDKVPRFAASAKFNLSPNQVAEKIGGLELDIGLRFSEITPPDKLHITTIVKKHTALDVSDTNGIGIEIRYNFNPNDSSRLKKDVDMGNRLKDLGLRPIYLVFSSISPRQDAISRLTNSGWTFLTGTDAINFANELLTIDFQKILDKPVIKKEVKKAVDEIFKLLVDSYPFQKINEKHSS